MEQGEVGRRGGVSAHSDLIRERRGEESRQTIAIVVSRVNGGTARSGEEGEGECTQ